MPYTLKPRAKLSFLCHICCYRVRLASDFDQLLSSVPVSVQDNVRSAEYKHAQNIQFKDQCPFFSFFQINGTLVGVLNIDLQTMLLLTF